MKLEMDLYANKKYKLRYTINKKPDELGRMIKNFYYEIDNANYTISTIENEHYKIHKIINNTKEEFIILDIPTLKIDLCPIKSMPLIYDYDTSKNKTEKEFTITFNLDNNSKLDMSFDKRYYVAFNKETKKCEVFDRTKDGLIDMKSKLEEYLFLDNGYLFIDYKEFKMIFTFYNNTNDNIETDFKFSNNIKDINPIDILFENFKNNYIISYDSNNILKSMLYKNVNTKSLEYCKYEKVDFEGSPYIYSLHPLLMDLYDVFYINSDIFKYWVIDKYEIGNDNEDDIFIREVYEIKDAESLEQLINIINSDIITSPILN